MSKSFSILLFLLAVIQFGATSQSRTQPDKAGNFRDGKFVITIDLRWDQHQRETLIELFELDTLLVNAIYKQDFDFVNNQTEWRILSQQQNKVEITKDLSKTDEMVKILLADLPEDKRTFSGWVDQPPYGVNDLIRENAFTYHDNTGCFFLSGYKEAQNIFLSGTFNNWSTMQLPMKKTTDGWSMCIELTPGKHLYKYIVDGRWMTDPGNRLTEGFHKWERNSIVFAYNHTFRLEGFEDARRVWVAGSFNGWRPREINMYPVNGAWERSLFLKEGTHAYKFRVNRRWILDPDNPVTRPDGNGNLNSFISIGDTLHFRLDGYTEAERVFVSGNFNAWKPAELEMEKTRAGWILPYVLAPGNYEYKFIVEGQWITDPDNPYSIGSGDYTNSFLTIKPNHTFTLEGFENATQVIVTGSFNGWSHSDYRMVKKEGKWVFPLWLKPGRYSYKFIVDGEWIIDPGNELQENNEFGGQNSVLWVDMQ
ncbi:MAG: glycogen-binding domain-containing protein [Bacteroidota bacterium]